MARTFLLALVAASCWVNSANAAFWLRPRGSGLDVLNPGKEQQQVEGNDFSDLLQTLQEITTDFTAGASRAKTALTTRGVYIRSTDDKYVVAMDVPGARRNDLTVRLERGTLHIEGHHQCPVVDSTTNATDPLCIERFYDASLTLPSDADEEQATAAMEAGVIRVTIPKIKEPRGMGRVLNLAEETAESIYSSAQAAAEAAAESARSAGSYVTDAAAAATESVKSLAAEASASAASLANEASVSAASLANQASASAASVASQATVTGAKASKSAASAASEASKSASSAASKASKSASSAASKATKTAGAQGAEESVKAKKVYERIKEAIVGGGTEGEVPVQKEEL
ncbi:hypothetical protein HK104_010966 [Borealophlyctis nickersoniae]|nr:hypothetical protein HK104_010966 [Borealophlyctis nickersoniae]